ncbi:hypothetical protein [Roseovarius amoyensis]|uniref:hypothetical protein n=1 Tax=Roseovarius amoyensis TaxID=2211448 RepID=UPI000DBE9451|nr:hypothetical protein [Roseovarius amoyensis]
MSDDPMNDSGTVLEEPRFGYAEPFDTSGDFKHLPKAERAAAKKRSFERKQHWARAHAAREYWTPEMHEEERQRLELEVQAMLEAREGEQRDAA